MRTPQFCIITPTAYLEKYAAQSQMHLVLAHLVDTDEIYAEFYRERTEYKIMDNGAFELGESYAPDRLIELAHKCRANAIVLPDYPAQHWEKTVDASTALIDDVKSAGFNTFFCPQSHVGDWNGWVKGYEWGARCSDIDIIGMSILAIPNALPHIPAAYARVVATEVLMHFNVFNPYKHHHYLGLNAGPALEIPPLLKMGALTSCDSSGPVWSAICGHRYNKLTDSYQPVKKISKHVDFDYPMTKNEDVLEAIQYNIDLTLELFK